MGILFFSHDGASTAFHKFFKNAMNVVETPSSGMGVLKGIERKRNSDLNQGRNSVKILREMTCKSPKLDLVNIDVHTKFGQILSIVLEILSGNEILT